MNSKFVLTLIGWLMAATAQAQIPIYSPAPMHSHCVATADGHRGPDFDLVIKRTGDPELEFWRSSKTPVEVRFLGFAEEAVIQTEWATSFMSTRCAEEFRHSVALPGIGFLSALDIRNDGCGFRHGRLLTLHLDSPTGTSPRLYALACEAVIEDVKNP